LDTFYIIATAVLTLVLVVTSIYYSVLASKRLEKSLVETKAELALASRPLLVIRAVVHESATVYEENIDAAPKGAHQTDIPLTSHFSSFEIFNAGNSPAIDICIYLLNSDKRVVQSETLGFLRNSEQALSFTPIKLDLHKPYYLLCEYESIRSRLKKVWYQTWLPFEAVETVSKNKISVNASEMDFKEVPLEGRISSCKL